MTNTTYQRCPWADVLYALDLDWWLMHLARVRQMFGGLLVSPQQLPGVRQELAWLDGARTNSGAAVLAQAAYWRARRVVLLGYDCQHTGGVTHWHGSHPKGLGDAHSVAEWPAQFLRILPRLADVEVVNATRDTALGLFPRATLEDALA